MRRILLLLSIVVAQLQSVAQDNQASENWTFLKEENGIKFFYRYADCDLKDELDQQLLLIKVENTTQNGYVIDYSWEIWYNGNCHTCQPDENSEFRKSIVIGPGKTLEPTCELYPRLSELTLFSKFIEFTSDDRLTSFDLKDIVLNPIED